MAVVGAGLPADPVHLPDPGPSGGVPVERGDQDGPFLQQGARLHLPALEAEGRGRRRTRAGAFTPTRPTPVCREGKLKGPRSRFRTTSGCFETKMTPAATECRGGLWGS